MPMDKEDGLKSNLLLGDVGGVGGGGCVMGGVGVQLLVLGWLDGLSRLGWVVGQSVSGMMRKGKGNGLSLLSPKRCIAGVGVQQDSITAYQDMGHTTLQNHTCSNHLYRLFNTSHTCPGTLCSWGLHHQGHCCRLCACPGSSSCCSKRSIQPGR